MSGTIDAMTGDPGPTKPKKPRGFAALDPKLVSEIGKKGGVAAHQAGTAHEFTHESAKIAGAKGGRASRRKRAHSPEKVSP
jgi:uncharacterized protein